MQGPMLIFICSPLKGDIKQNQVKAREYSRDCILQGHVPIAPHIYFTEFLNEEDHEERKLGIEAGLKLLKLCDEIWIYGEPSEGMKMEIEEARRLGIVDRNRIV